MKSILDRSFHYTPSIQTNLRETFARIRRELGTNMSETRTAAATGMKVTPMRQYGPGLAGPTRMVLGK